jgi:diguanylate cyclase (GGDEF)-like protein
MSAAETAAPGAQETRLSGTVTRAVDSAQGLPSNQIHKIARDRFSRLWLAGPAGLSCFDGSAVHTYDRRNGLKCSGLRSVAVGVDGTLWLGTDQGLEALDADAHPLPWVAWFAWPYGLCEHIDAAGASIWIGSANGLVKLDTGSVEAGPRIAFHADVGFVRHIVRVSDSHVYAASDTFGLIECDGSSWSQVRCPNLAGHLIIQLALGPSGQLLVGTTTGLFVIDSTSVAGTSARPIPIGGGHEVTAVGAGQDGWWVALRDTLLALPYRQAGPESAILERYQLDSRIRDLAFDDLGNVWIATDTSGLALVSCLRHALKKIDIGNSGAVLSIKPGPADTYAIGGDKLFGVATLAPGAANASLRLPAGLPETTVWDSHADASGLWLATHDGLYHAKPGGALTRVFRDDPVLGAPARVLLAVADALWVGTLRGLSRITHTGAQELRPADKQALGYVYALYADPSARLWVATLGRGLWREEAGQLEPVIGGPLSATGNTYAVATGPGGDTVVLQDEKVILLDDQLRPRLVEESYPVSGWTVQWLDGQTVAIGSSHGLRLLNIASGLVTMQVRSFFGARAWEFTNNRSLVQDRQGGLLCGVTGGLLRIDLTGLTAFLQPPVVRLLDVTWHGTVAQQRGSTYHVRPGRWSVRAQAFAAWFVDHEQLEFRFKLVGFEEDWSALQFKPVVTYNSLPVGRYSLLVQPHSPLTGFGAPATLCELVVTTPWWAMGWLAALAAADGAYDRLVQSRTRNQRLGERNLALEDEVAGRTTALRSANEALQRAHDELEVMSQTDALTQLANRRHFDRQLSHELDRARRLNTPLCLVMLDIDHFKSINDQLGHQVGDDYLCAVAGVLRTCSRSVTDIVARYGGEEFAIVCVGANLEQGLIAAGRMRAGVEALGPLHQRMPRQITISAGVTTLDPLEQVTEAQFIARADLALYEAKRRGRNQVVAMPFTVEVPKAP